MESCLDIKTIEGEQAISGAYWLNQTGVIFQVKLGYNSMLFFLSGLLVIYSPDFWIFLGVERGQIHFIAAQCFER